MFLLPWQYLAQTMLGRTNRVLCFHWPGFPEMIKRNMQFQVCNAKFAKHQ